MKTLTSLLVFFFCIHLQFSHAAVSDDFTYDETRVENELATIQSIENNVLHHEALSSEQQEFVKTLVAPNNTDDGNGYKFVSLMAGCCCSLSGAAVASLYYYYKSGDTDKGKESLKFGLLGSAIPGVLYLILIYTSAAGTDLFSLLGI
jgi:hypothetical protein